MSTVTPIELLGTSPPPVRKEEPLYEIVNGQRVELPPMSAFAGLIASELHVSLGAHARTVGCGRAFTEVLLRLPLQKDRNRRPDVAYVSYERWPRDRPIPKSDNAWAVAPDLAIEVVSPNDFAEELLEKVQEYFLAGAKQVWVVYPILGMIQVYESLARIRVLTRADELDGGSVLPGFRLPLAQLFPEEADAS
jgi:Uma2 family endonuclease